MASWYFFSNQALVKVFGTEITIRPPSKELMKVFLNQVVKLALDRVSSSSPSVACQRAWRSIDQGAV